MGKGGTKFSGEAVSVRSGKGKSGNSTKELKKKMDKFIETGVHEEVERMRQERNNQLPALPDLDINRQFVFLELAVGNKSIGRLVVELFDDMVPVAANHFRNRCMPGSSAGLAGASFYKLLPHYAIWGASSPRAGEGMRLQPCTRLRNVEAGTVCISHNGEEIAIALTRALDLDRTHQVVGRVHKGKELLEQVTDLRTAPDDSPIPRVTITKAGPTNHLGVHEELGEGASGPPKDMATRLQEASAEARSAVMEALEVGLGQKRKADGPADGEGAAAAGPSGSAAQHQAGAAGQAQQQQQQAKAAGAPARNVKSKMLDSLVFGSADDDSSSGSSQSGSGSDAEG